MSTVAAIVEGDGEVAALPVLLRRLQEWLLPGTWCEVQRPIRVHRDRFLNRKPEFHRHLALATQKCGPAGWVLILLDADDDCPARLGQAILQRAHADFPHSRISVVIANREFEAWFIAAAPSLQGFRGFQWRGESCEAESPRNAKGWMREHMPGQTYRETTDQPAFCQQMDLTLAHTGSRSFRKLCSEWQKQQAGHP